MAAQITSTTRSELESQGAEIVRRLGGHWSNKGGMCRCPAHNDHDPSLSVRVGSTTLLFKCWAGCEGVDVIRAIRDQGILGGAHIRSRPSADDDAVDDGRWRLAKAHEIWNKARPLWGTPALRYLQERGLSPPSSELRYLAGTPCGPKGAVSFRPALIAAVRDDRGFVAIQRTFLAKHAPIKATDLAKAKMGLGSYGRGAVRLYDASSELGIAEGIETAIAAHHLLGIPVWAVLGSERFPLVELPSAISTLVLLADPGKAGDRAIALARKAHDRPGLTIETERPSTGDWNDVLLRHLRPTESYAPA